MPMNKKTHTQIHLWIPVKDLEEFDTYAAHGNRAEAVRIAMHRYTLWQKEIYAVPEKKKRVVKVPKMKKAR